MLRQDVVAPGAVSDEEVAAGESAHKAIDAFIALRSRREPDPDEREPSYAESVRRYHAAQDAARRAEWAAYHEAQAERLRRTLERLVAVHEVQARKLAEMVSD
jgi:hypothetical protein